MKNSSQKIKPIFPTLLSVFLVGIFIIFSLMEFRHTNKILNQYETGIKEVAINKTNLYFDDLKTITVNAANNFENNSSIHKPLDLKTLLTLDRRLTSIYLVRNDGKIIDATEKEYNQKIIREIAIKTSELHLFEVFVSGVYKGTLANYDAISLAIPLGKKVAFKDLVMVLEFRIDPYKNDVTQEFLNPNYKIAIFDQFNKAVIWPFDPVYLESLDLNAETFFEGKNKYNLSSNTTKENWRIIVFFTSTNFEIYRVFTILFLVFALYICLYELLVEFWGVNTAKTYFENIDFAILNQINEGVIIANNTGIILFANEAAHNIFADRKNSLRNVTLKEILGNAGDNLETQDKHFISTVMFRDNILKAIHSPIIKNNKILGSLTVIRNNNDNSNIDHRVLHKLIESLPQGIVFFNKHHEVVLSNLIAKCLLSNLTIGANIEVIDKELASIIYNNIDTGLSKRTQTSTGHNCEITPIYDDDGIYVGTLVILLT
ncbi:PAS domain-containing protein [Desulfotomaculum sp. 1211_IL3151]|uniref:PAS domain-containing protein n=1 Tax=Desulfotomaculum sp. 1211_IL3151 TaxID=3084055 RepID=UPI002FDA2174